MVSTYRECILDRLSFLEALIVEDFSPCCDSSRFATSCILRAPTAHAIETVSFFCVRSTYADSADITYIDSTLFPIDSRKKGSPIILSADWNIFLHSQGQTKEGSLLFQAGTGYIIEGAGSSPFRTRDIRS